jgi:hypothetical protein
MKPIKLTTQTPDQELVSFLKTYHPVIPSTSQFQENRLMEAIKQPKQGANSSSYQFRWFSPRFIITVIALIVFSNLLRGKFMPQIAQEMQDLETFMVNSWNGSMAQDHEPELYFVTLDSEF